MQRNVQNIRKQTAKISRAITQSPPVATGVSSALLNDTSALGDKREGHLQPQAPSASLSHDGMPVGSSASELHPRPSAGPRAVARALAQRQPPGQPQSCPRGRGLARAWPQLPSQERGCFRAGCPGSSQSLSMAWADRIQQRVSTCQFTSTGEQTCTSYHFALCRSCFAGPR